MGFDISRSTTDGVVTLALAGELDLATRDTFADALAELSDDERSQLVVDLSDLTFLDSTGIGLLVAVAVAAREKGGSVTVLGVSGSPLRALEITGVLDLLTGALVEDTTEA